MQPGTYRFYISYTATREASCGTTCGNKCQSDDEFIIPINPGAGAPPPAPAKLTLGPETTMPGTTGTPYSLQMTASVSDAKTFSISAGALPPGLAINSSTGLISGTPTAGGTFDFMVYAKVNADTRSDTKAEQIVVRDPLKITASEPFSETRKAKGEVGVPFDAMLAATGGLGPYQWSVTTGELPPGLDLTEGAISGTPTAAGSYAFIATVTDSENRTVQYTARVVVVEKLAVTTRLFRLAKVGKLFGAKLKTSGGAKPVSWRITAGQLPKGVRFSRTLGVLAGVPKKARRYTLRFEATDELGVIAKKTLRLTVAP